MIGRSIFLFLSNLLLILAGCPENGVLSYGSDGTAFCFVYERFPAKFLIAEQNCRRSGGHLVSVGDSLVNDFVAQMGSEAFDVMGVDSFWIGAHNLRGSHDWEWTDDSPFEYANWLNGEPTENACLSLFFNGSWQGVSCFLDKPYVCEVEASAFPTTPAPIRNVTKPLITTTPNAKTTKPVRHTTAKKHHKTKRPTHYPKRTTHKIKPTKPHTTPKPPTKKPVDPCPKYWAYLKKTGLCYGVISAAKNPMGCFDHGAIEGSIHSEEENEFVGELARYEENYRNAKVQLSLWNGLDGKWHWADKTSANYFNWAKNENKYWGCVRFNTCTSSPCNKGEPTNIWTTVSCFSPIDYLLCTKKP